MASGAGNWNLRSPAVRRIMQEIKELQDTESTDFIAEAMEDDIFEFAFVVRGPPDTEFERPGRGACGGGGLYHGRILLPAEYPFKPPSFLMLTPSGRFQTGVKICLSISSHHPEHWQPSWSVRTALTALVAFMPSPGAGALGSLDYTKEERQQLAAKSRVAPPKVASAARQRVVDGLHARMLELEVSGRVERGGGDGDGAEAPAAALARLRAEVEAARGGGSGGGGVDDVGARGGGDQAAPAAAKAGGGAGAEAAPSGRDAAAGAGVRGDQLEGAAAAAAAAPAARRRAGAGAPEPAAAGAAGARAPRGAAGAPGGTAARARARALQQQAAAGDRGLTLLAVVLSVAIAAMLLRKIATALGGGGRVDALLHSAP
ncbi:MAG: ubiquitin-conjugating enzyme/RWD-like protein [Monoraphidium minutum]|nr:MAG: ubiquitin-conjugating enzyme/RWD-like protein [Monoraphidium minutum]